MGEVFRLSAAGVTRPSCHTFESGFETHRLRQIEIGANLIMARIGMLNFMSRR
jgi:hypothetical protein